MSGSATVQAPANIAFIKYWGARDLRAAIPRNRSISMTLRECVSRTRVDVLDDGAVDEVLVAGADGELAPAAGSFRDRVTAQLGRLRGWSGVANGFAVRTRNSFPASAGMASSASGFAALTLATVRALGLDPGVGELSELARLSGSGSASRSVMGGYVEWPVGEGVAGSTGGYPAAQIAPAEHWDLRDVIAIIQRGPKQVSSLEGHVRAPSSPHYATRQELLPARLDAVRRAIRERSLATLGPVLEEDAIELHLVAMSSRPAIFYWQPATLDALAAVRALREGGVEAYGTMDAGANVHVICEPEHEAAVAATLASTAGVTEVLRDGVGPGPCALESFDA